MSKEMPLRERRQLQGKLLEEWVEVDPEAAVAAALNSLEMQNLDQMNAALLRSFRKKIMDQPTLFWPMIRDQRFGLATAHLRAMWIATLGKSDPALLSSYIGELQPQARIQAVTCCLEGLNASPDKAKAFLDQLASLPDTPENRGFWKASAGYLAKSKSEDLIAWISGAKSEGERQMYLEGFTSRWGETMGKSGEFRDELEKLPEEFRKGAAMKVLEKSYYPESVVDVADYLMDQGDWEALAKSIAPRLNDSPSRHPEELVAWASGLPEREETEDLYRTAIRQQINDDPGKAREWIDGLPSGWKRDNALAEYVNSALNGRNDSSGAEWAMGRIESSAFRQTAEEMQQEWAARRKK